MRFFTKYHLQEHVRTHSRQELLVCEVCDQGFRRQQELRYHMQGHTGEWSFRCESCGMGFARQHYLRAHVRRFHVQ